MPHPVELAGRDSAAKRAEIARGLVERDLAAAVLTLPDSIAWLLNVRGSDIARTPVPLAFAILHADGRVELFADPAKGDAALRAHLGPEVAIAPPEALRRRRSTRSRAGGGRPGERAGLGRRPAAAAGGAEVVWERDPCILPKACKTEAEIAGARAAHLRDGAAMAGFLAWLDATAPEGGLTEIDVVRKLEAIRAATGGCATSRSRRSAAPGRTARSCTTGSPRRPTARWRRASCCSSTAARSTPTAPPTSPAPSRSGRCRRAAVRPFTLVLKGLIAMSRLRWPAGLAGRDIDAVARAALWRAGLDYDHGTGHGVGVLSRRARGAAEPVAPRARAAAARA